MSDFTLIIAGLPGSGKGTQGHLLAEKLPANYLVTGDIIRQIRQENSPLGKAVKARYDQGLPQPDEVIVDIFKAKVKELLAQSQYKRLILDGFPRSLNQAQILDQFAQEINFPLPYFIYLAVQPQSVVERLSKRLFCQQCFASYQPKDQEYQSKICSRCGSKLWWRDQDQPAIVKIRIAKEKEILDQLINYYQQKHRLITVDGEPAIDQVHQQVSRSLQEKRIIEPGT